jgi:hypothetical protein
LVSSLEKAVQLTPSEKPVPLPLLLEPFLQFLSQAPRAHYNPVIENLIEPLLKAFEVEEPPKKKRKIEQSSEEGGVRAIRMAYSDGEPLEVSAVREVVLKSIFDKASLEETAQGNRQRLYKLYADHTPREDD